jgi:hypothetical protein
MTTSAMVLDESSEAVLHTSPNEGGSTYVVMPDQTGVTVVVRREERIA